jgi:hypothetical protein
MQVLRDRNDNPPYPQDDLREFEPFELIVELDLRCRHYEFGSTSSAVYRGDVLRMFQDGPDKDTGLWVLGVHAFCCKEAKFR